MNPLPRFAEPGALNVVGSWSGQNDHLIVDEGVSALIAGFTRYNPPLGVPELCQFIASFAGEQRGMNINPDQVLIGSGAKPGLFFLRALGVK